MLCYSLILGLAVWALAPAAPEKTGVSAQTANSANPHFCCIEALAPIMTSSEAARPRTPVEVAGAAAMEPDVPYNEALPPADEPIKALEARCRRIKDVMLAASPFTRVLCVLEHLTFPPDLCPSPRAFTYAYPVDVLPVAFRPTTRQRPVTYY